MRRLGWRPRIADARRDFERAELNGLADRDLQMRDAPRDLVERRENGDRVFDLVGKSRGPDQTRNDKDCKPKA